jgi:hypothetical protein
MTSISHENQIIQIVFENVFCIIMINAAAPKRDAPAAVLGAVNAKNLLALPCLEEALRQGTLGLLWIFMLWVRTPFMRVSAEPIS